jgi:hypothetical protein
MKQLTKHLEKKKCQPFPSFLYSLNCILDCCPRLEQSFVDKKLGESIHHPRYYFLSLHLIFHTEFSGNNIVDWGEFWKDDGQMLWIFLTTLKFWKFGWHMQHDIYIKVILIIFFQRTKDWLSALFSFQPFSITSYLMFQLVSNAFTNSTTYWHLNSFCR